MGGYAIQETSIEFALLIIDVYKYLVNTHKEFVLSKQLLRSGTSIGANIQEANQGSSKRDFLHKMTLSLKEAYETEYRITLLDKSNYLDGYDKKDKLIMQSQDMAKVLISIVKTTKANLNE